MPIHSCPKAVCKHELHHCPDCDRVYCSKCGREWGYYPPTIVYTSNVPENTTWSGSNSAIYCSHAGP